MTAWHKWGKLHCLVMSITMNARFWSHCLQDSHSVSMQNLFMVMFIFIHSSLFCALLSILSPLESPVKLTYVSMCVYDHCAVQLHGDEEEYRTTLLRGASKTIYSFIWQRLSNRLWTREGQQQQWLLFPSTGVCVVSEDYKYLSVHTDNKLDCNKNTGTWLRSFNIWWMMLGVFYECVVLSTILDAMVCWGRKLTVSDNNRLNKLRPCYSTEYHRRPFLPVAIKLYNSPLRHLDYFHV